MTTKQKQNSSRLQKETNILSLEDQDLDLVLKSLVQELSQFRNQSNSNPKTKESKETKSKASNLASRAKQAANGLLAETAQGALSALGVDIESEPLEQALEVGEDLLAEGIKQLAKLF